MLFVISRIPITSEEVKVFDYELLSFFVYKNSILIFSIDENKL
jgi:hypothetical protein